MGATELAIAGLVVVALTVVLLSGAHRAGGDAMVQEWSRAHALKLTARNRPFVSYYLLLGRYLRTIGGVGGMVLGRIAAVSTGVDVDSGSLWWVWIMGGYLAGAMWAELFLTRPTAPAPAASLSPRRLASYVPARLRWALRLAGAASLATGIAAWAVPTTRTHRVSAVLDAPGLSPTAALALGGAGMVIAGLVEFLQMTIVRRPQPVVTTDLLEADDAVRASSVHSLAGAGLGMVLIITASVSTRLIDAAGPLPIGLGAIPFVVFVAGLLGWRYYSHRAWRVRRPRTSSTVAA